MRGLFLASACVCILAVGTISAFLFANGLPFFAKYSAWDFITGTEWAPLRNVFGILPMIVGSFYVTFGALLLGAPIGILTAILMARFASKPVVKVMKPAVALLAGIPSVVYGFFGLMLLVPFVRKAFGGTGKSVLVASVLLAIMILPTIIQTSEAAINAVPGSYYEGSLALGATHESSVFRSVVPAARPGIISGIVLGLDAGSEEAHPGSVDQVVHYARKNTCHGDSFFDKNGTMRLGSCPTTLKSGSAAARAYGTVDIRERHRHRLEMNNAYRQAFEEGGMILSGVNEEEQLVDIVELRDHPWFLACSFQPEFKSRPNRAHPLFRDFIGAALIVVIVAAAVNLILGTIGLIIALVIMIPLSALIIRHLHKKWNAWETEEKIKLENEKEHIEEHIESEKDNAQERLEFDKDMVKERLEKR